MYEINDTSPFTCFFKYFFNKTYHKKTTLYETCSQAQFLDKEIITKCLAISIFVTLNPKNFIATLRMFAIKKTELAFPLIFL